MACHSNHNSVCISIPYSYAILVSLHALGYGIISVIPGHILLSLGIDDDMELVFGISQLIFGIGTMIAPPIAGTDTPNTATSTLHMHCLTNYCDLIGSYCDIGT